jgi:hypothetical protein
MFYIVDPVGLIMKEIAGKSALERVKKMAWKNAKEAAKWVECHEKESN